MLHGQEAGSERQNALLKAGASAVLTVLDGDRTLDQVAARRQRSGYALASDALGGDLEGFIGADTFDRLMATTGTSLAALKSAAASPTFVPKMLDLTATLEATTRETTIKTHNLIGKLEGKHPEAGAVLFMAHWDHFGVCAEPPAEHLICNGAIDNASGVAALTEVARRLSRVAQLDRDIYFVATTAEELGLLGAESFAENPPLPLKQVVAAFNIDSIAIAPAGTPLAIVGKGTTRLDGQIAAVARQQKRVLVQGDEANAYVKRQDGWALLQHDVPAVMVTSAYGNLKLLERYFDTSYHRPSDVVKPGLELGGAAEDVTFLVALGRWFADPRKVPASAPLSR
jgi:Zn-dependent M28 family amino/carboxypeptidase